jgi:transposase
MLLSEGQMSDYKGAALMLPALPKAKDLLADKGYDADWFRTALATRGVAACIPLKIQPKTPDPARRRALQATPQNREHVWADQRLAAHPNPIRPMRPHLLLSHPHRRGRHLLAVINES